MCKIAKLDANFAINLYFCRTNICLKSVCRKLFNFSYSGDDSDAFADDEAPSSDGMEERDDISLISTVSSVGEDDIYLSEPTYNNLDPVWAQRHGFGPGNEKCLRIMFAKFFVSRFICEGPCDYVD